MAPITSWALTALLLPFSALASPTTNLDSLAARHDNGKGNDKGNNGKGKGNGGNKTKAPTVTIDCGKLVGTTTTLPSATSSVNQYFGVPFAAPPVRFEKPKPAQPWKGTRNATKRAAACIQQFGGSSTASAFTRQVFNDPPPIESEDCLFLNVFQPGGDNAPKGGYPVLFWLFGGGLQYGNSGQPAYDGSWFAGFEDVIVVTTNYRTNVFGFPASPELSVTDRNLGFYDQRMALQWVQKNIKSFGGDPKKVTIFGESAGALSVDALVTTNYENPPFRAAIMQSGQASLARFQARGNTTADWLELASLLGCGDAASPIACIRTKDPVLIKETAENNTLTFQPVADNVTLSSNAQAARAAKKIANVPIMIGTNAQEGRVFAIGQNNLTAYLTTTFQNPALIAAVNASYPRGQNGLLTDYDIISAIYTDVVFTCPGALTANASAAAGYDTWRYFYTASFPNLNAVERIGIDLQAFHSSEIPIVFSTYRNSTSTQRGEPTAQQEALSKYMRGAWADFARNPKNGPGWNKLGTYNGTDLGVLGWQGSSGVTLANKTIADSKCKVFTPLYNLLGA